jgi:hypothetical protein
VTNLTKPIAINSTELLLYKGGAVRSGSGRRASLSIPNRVAVVLTYGLFVAVISLWLIAFPIASGLSFGRSLPGLLAQALLRHGHSIVDAARIGKGAPVGELLGEVVDGEE